MGSIDDRQGRSTDAVHNLEKALELDPRNLFILQQFAITYLMRRSAEEATALDRAQGVGPARIADRGCFEPMVDLNWLADPEPLHKTCRGV